MSVGGTSDRATRQSIHNGRSMMSAVMRTGPFWHCSVLARYPGDSTFVPRRQLSFPAGNAPTNQRARPLTNIIPVGGRGDERGSVSRAASLC